MDHLSLILPDYRKARTCSMKWANGCGAAPGASPTAF